MTQPDADLVTACTDDEDLDAVIGEPVSDESALGEFCEAAQPEAAIVAEGEDA